MNFFFPQSEKSFGGVDRRDRHANEVARGLVGDPEGGLETLRGVPVELYEEHTDQRTNIYTS